MDPEAVKQALQEEFDKALSAWADKEAQRSISPMSFAQSATRHTPDPADVLLGHCEAIKKIANRLGVDLDNDDLSEERLHRELVARPGGPDY